MALTLEERAEIGRRYWTERESPAKLATEFDITREWAQKVAKANKPTPIHNETPDTAEAGRGLVVPAEAETDLVGTGIHSTASA